MMTDDNSHKNGGLSVDERTNHSASTWSLTNGEYHEKEEFQSMSSIPNNTDDAYTWTMIDSFTDILDDPLVCHFDNDNGQLNSNEKELIVTSSISSDQNNNATSCVTNCTFSNCSDEIGICSLDNTYNCKIFLKQIPSYPFLYYDDKHPAYSALITNVSDSPC